MTSFFAWNTRGFNKMRKHRSVRHWLRTTSSAPLFGCLLETRVQEENSKQIFDFVFPGWNLASNYDFNRLGRIWFVSSPLITSTVLYNSAQLITLGLTTPRGENLLCSCIYASNFQRERKALWKDIRICDNLYGQSGLPWVLMGDYNEVLSTGDHSQQRVIHNSGMNEFQQVAADCNLRDLPYTGPKFTWSNNTISKKLDRVLVNGSWSTTFLQSYVAFESNGISDHTRSTVTASASNAHKRPTFRFFNYLTELPDFKQVIYQFWNSTEPLHHSRSALHRFHKKLKALKQIIRALNKNKYGDITRLAREAFENLCKKQDEALTNPSGNSFQVITEATATWDHYASVEEKFFKQKSRNTWLECGDHNTTFFHNSIKSRNSGNTIKQLTPSEGHLIKDSQEIKSEAVSFFRNLLQAPASQETISEVFLEDLINYRCPLSTTERLTALVSVEEIKKVLFSMAPNKSSGPDGYTAEFFQSTWDITGSDFITAVQSFFFYGFMPHGVNATTLALLPKKENAQAMRDFRPIACCNIIYKTISKLLANRLSTILPEAIEPNQSAFIQGRLLLENVLLATELVKDYHKTSISPRSSLKLDISKAFDTLRWDFIVVTLKVMGLPDIFIHWIFMCISTASFSVSVNGELNGFFQSSRGIRQGCALSPQLYDIANNVLSLLLNRAALEGQIGHHPQCKEVHITHLSFADDIMVFFDGTEKSLEKIMVVLNAYSAASGLEVNMAKSAIYIAGKVQPSFISMVNSMNFQVEQLPIRYLGLPLTTKIMSKEDYEPLIDKIRGRFLSWKNRTLSYAGRLQLIKSVIASTSNFWCSVFNLPQACLDLIESMCSAYLWSGSPNITTKAKVSWEEVTRPKNEGGLGIRKLKDISLVFSLSLIWRLLSKSDSLWVAWVDKNLLCGKTFWEAKNSPKGSWIWRKLLQLRDIAKEFVRYKINDGVSTSFWFDIWTEMGCLSNLVGDNGFHKLGIQRSASVADATSDGNWSLRRCRSQQLIAITDHIHSIQPPSPEAGADVIHWKSSSSEFKIEFNAKSTWNLLRNHHPTVPWGKIIWFAYAIPRFSFVSWLAMRNKLSTGSRMAQWGAQQVCPLCGERNETREHLFFACPYSFNIWVPLCFKLQGRIPTPDWAYTINSLIHNRKDRLNNIIYRLLFQITIYYVWRERNQRIHHHQRQPHQRIMQLIAKTVLERINSRRKTHAEETKKLADRWSILRPPIN